MKSRTILKSQYDEIGTFLCDQYLAKHDLYKMKKDTQEKLSSLMNDELPKLVKEACEQYPEYFDIKTFKVSNFGNLFEYHTIDKCGTSIKRLRTIWDGSPNACWSQKREEVSDVIYSKLKENGVHDIWGSYLPYNASRKKVVIDGKEKTISDSDLRSIDFTAIPLSNIVDTSSQSFYDSVSYRSLVEYLGDHPAILDVITDYLIEYGKYVKFVKSLSCVFSTVTTTNMLKNEIPEAYDYFYSKYGERYEKEDKMKEEKNKKQKKAQCDNIEAVRASIA